MNPDEGGSAKRCPKRCRIYFPKVKKVPDLLKMQKGAGKGAGFIKGLQQLIRSYSFADTPILIALMAIEDSDAWVGGRGLYCRGSRTT